MRYLVCKRALILYNISKKKATAIPLQNNEDSSFFKKKIESLFNDYHHYLGFELLSMISIFTEYHGANMKKHREMQSPKKPNMNTGTLPLFNIMIMVHITIEATTIFKQEIIMVTFIIIKQL